MRNLLEMFEAEIAAHNIKWCRGEGCHLGSSHNRGFAVVEDRTIHYSRSMGTRATFHGGLHEIGHIIHDQKDMRRFEAEKQAEDYATRRCRELGVSVPKQTIHRGVSYVRRMKRWGDNVKKGMKGESNE